MDKNAALLLGMVYSVEMDPSTGQMFRDRVRCEAMESLGYEIKTMDDKHDGDLERVRNLFLPPAYASLLSILALLISFFYRKQWGSRPAQMMTSALLRGVLTAELILLTVDVC